MRRYSLSNNAWISSVCLADPWCKLQAMGSIHGILPGDEVITNVDVFRKLYEVVGLGWVYAITRNSFINNLANRYVISCHVSTSTYQVFSIWLCPRHYTKHFHVSSAGYMLCGLSTDSPSQAALTLKLFCARGKKLAKDPSLLIRLDMCGIVWWCFCWMTVGWGALRF